MPEAPLIAHNNRFPHNRLIYASIFEFVERFIPLYRGRLYDLGCGEQPYREFLLRYADSYTGVDWGATLHTLKAEIVADLNGPLPIADASADTVFSISVMEHLREPGVFLSEANRILAPGGWMVLQVPFMWWVHEAPYDYYRYTRFGLIYMLEKAGFEQVEVFEQMGYWSMATLKFNYQSLRLIRGPRPVRALIRLLLRAVWAVDQWVAPRLDRHWPSANETAGYFAIGRKPATPSTPTSGT